MWQRKGNGVIVKTKQKTFSLVEMLIAIGLGSFLLFIAAASYTDFYRLQIKQKEQLYLQSEAHQLLHYFQQHFQHINYVGEKRTDTNFDLFQHNGRNSYIPHKNCIIAFYDVNQDGCLGKRKTKTTACKLGEINNTKDVLKEVFGFKLQNKEIYTFSTKLDHCMKTECRRLVNHCNGNWSILTSVNDFHVNQLDFSWKNEYNLLQVTLELVSVKDPAVAYRTISHIFLLNHE